MFGYWCSSFWMLSRIFCIVDSVTEVLQLRWVETLLYNRFPFSFVTIFFYSNQDENWLFPRAHEALASPHALAKTNIDTYLVEKIKRDFLQLAWLLIEGLYTFKLYTRLVLDEFKPMAWIQAWTLGRQINGLGKLTCLTNRQPDI